MEQDEGTEHGYETKSHGFGGTLAFKEPVRHVSRAFT